MVAASRRGRSHLRRNGFRGARGKSVEDSTVRVLLVRLKKAQIRVARTVLESRGHTVTLREGDNSAQLPSYEQPYDLVVERWLTPDKSGLASSAGSTRGAFVLTIIDGQQDPARVAKVLATGSDDVIAESSSERILYERILVAEIAVFRRLARRREEAITVSEIAAQLEKEEGLRDLAENLATTLNCIGDAVISYTAAGAVTWMNPVAEKLTAWAVEEARGRPLDDIFKIVDAATRSVVENPVTSVLRKGAAIAPGAHWTLVRRDGSEIQIADSCAALKGADNLVRGAVLVFRDVSAEHRCERAPRKKSAGALPCGTYGIRRNPCRGSSARDQQSARIRDLESRLGARGHSRVR
jgi:PAS domain S-box-containing protein